jgi:uncharacterized DUF497 family protein
LIFAWDETNRGHVAKHGVTSAEAEFVVEGAAAPFPQAVGGGKRRVWGATSSGRLLQVIYVLKKQDDVAFESVAPQDWAALQTAPHARVVRVIHAMELTDDMKRQLRRRRRQA